MGIVISHLAEPPPDRRPGGRADPGPRRLDGVPVPGALPTSSGSIVALGHPTLGRFSFLTADPFDWLWARGRQVRVAGHGRPLEPADPFVVFAERLARYRTEPLPGLPPFQGGAAGLFGYDLCHHLERLPRPRCDDFAVPDLAVGFYDWVVAFDHEADRAWLISTGLPETDPRRRRRRARTAAARSQATACGVTPAPPSRGRRPRPRHCWRPSGPFPGLAGLTSNFDRAGYLETVRRAIEYIHAGDCFQVNVAQRLLYPAIASAAGAVRPAARAQRRAVRRLLRPGRLRPRQCLAGAVPARGPTARSKPGRSRAPGRAATRPRRTRPAPTSCSPAPRIGPRTS